MYKNAFDNISIGVVSLSPGALIDNIIPPVNEREIISTVIMPLSITRRVLCGAIITACTHLWRNVSTLVSALVTRLSNVSILRDEFDAWGRKPYICKAKFCFRRVVETEFCLTYIWFTRYASHEMGFVSTDSLTFYLYVELQLHDNIPSKYRSL